MRIIWLLSLCKKKCDVVYSHRDHHDTQSYMKGFPAEPYYKNLQNNSNRRRTLTCMRLISEDMANTGKFEPNTTVKMQKRYPRSRLFSLNSTIYRSSKKKSNWNRTTLSLLEL